MKLIIARHGNTFNPDDKPVFAGSTNDLPLVEKGFSQAKNIAKYLKENNLLPEVIYVSPLIRTKAYGETIKSELNLNCDIKVTEALKELDYGVWTGLSNEEVIELGFKKELDDWNLKGVFPSNAKWSISEKEIKNSVLEFVDKLVEDHSNLENILLVSSNGIIRYFLELVDGLFSEHQKEGILKVKTGSISCFKYKDENWVLKSFNFNP